MKLTMKQIEKIRENTPAGLSGKQVHLKDTLGHFTPVNANWSYVAGWIDYDGIPVLVATRFGEVL